MKKLILILCVFCFSTISFSQTDTIFKKDGKKIICTITMVNQVSVYYKIKGEEIEEIELSKVSDFTGRNKIQASKDFLMNIKNANDSVTISDELNYMKTCFRNFHSEYKIGAISTFAGIAISCSSLLFSAEDSSRNTAAIGGAAISLIGSIILIDSHKWIGRAGMGITGNGLTIKYVLK